jgi:hypothetical protein
MSSYNENDFDPFIPPFLRQPPSPPRDEYSPSAAPRKSAIYEPTSCGQVLMTGVIGVAVVAFIILGITNPLYILGGLVLAGLIAQEYQ